MLQDAADVLGVVDAADAHDGVELVDQPVFVASDEKLVAADGQRDLVLAGVAGSTFRPGMPLETQRRNALQPSVLVEPSESLTSCAQRISMVLLVSLTRLRRPRSMPILVMDAPSLDLAGQRRRVGSHRLEVSRHKVDGRQGDGHVLGGENAVHIDGIGEDGALQVEPQVCHYSSPPS